MHLVDETADIDDAAKAIAAAKTFDYATSCLADNAVVAAAEIYDDLVARLVAHGGYVCTTDEKARLRAFMWLQPGAAIPAVAASRNRRRGLPKWGSRCRTIAGF